MENNSKDDVLSSSDAQQETNALLRKLQQIRQLRQNGLLSSLGGDDPFSLLTQPGSSLSLLTSLASKYSTGQPPNPLLPTNDGNILRPPFTPWTPEMPLTLPPWAPTTSEDFLFGINKCYLPGINYNAPLPSQTPLLPTLNTMETQRRIQEIPKLRRSSSSVTTRTKTRKRSAVHLDASAENVNKSRRISVRSGSATKQKRTKWTSNDLAILWESISVHGNEWQKVKTSLTGRTYHQVKDKGKRLLHEKGWETGRSKIQNDLACERAKIIALNVLTTLNGKAE